MTPKELIKHLKSFKKQNQVIAYDIWQIEDVKAQAPYLTKKQCEKVINAMERRKDANIGLSWDVMDCHIREIKNEKSSDV